MELDVRVIARPEGFDQTKAVMLSSKQKMRLLQCVAEDNGKRSLALRARSAAMGLADVHSGDSSSAPGHGDDSSTHNNGVEEADVHSIRTFSSGHSDSWSGSAESVNMMEGFFGDPDLDVEVLPLVHLWVDMAAQLKQEDIADPRELFEERDTIVR